MNDIDIARRHARRMGEALLHFAEGGDVQVLAPSTNRWQITKSPCNDVCMGSLRPLRIRPKRESK